MSVGVCSKGPTSKMTKSTLTEEILNQNSGIHSVQQSLAKQLKGIQKLKHEEFMSSKTNMTKKNSSCTVTNNSVNSQKHIHTSTPTTAGTEIDKSKQMAYGNRRQWDRRNKAVKKAAGNNRISNSHSSKTAGNVVNQKKTVLLLGDSHVRRLNDCNFLPERISAKGLGGLRSNQTLSRHKQTINSELSKTDEVIIYIGSNDDSKGVKPEKVTGNVHFACK